MSDVQLNISREVIQPILDAKIKKAIIDAFGGEKDLIEKIIDEVINKKVNSEGKVDSYSHSNKYNWFDIIVTKTIQDEITAGVKEIIKESSQNILEHLKKYIQTKKGSEALAKGLISGLDGSFSNSWNSKVNIEFYPNVVEY